jgi:hypothetical protein
MKQIDISGQIFGRITVINYDKAGKWNCVCSCGTQKQINSINLRKGITVSCGCYAREVNTRHGKAGTRVYGIWENMKARCSSPSNAYWHRYGGRGIRVCASWQNFEAFYADMGDPPSTYHSLGRIDNNGNYMLSNCRWETKEQQDNNKCLNHFVEIEGITKTLTQWARINNLKPSTVLSRIHYGWNEVDAVTVAPMRGYAYCRSACEVSQ